MLTKLKTIPKEKYWDYFIIVARVLIGWTFLRYGSGKLTTGQFGLSEAELLTPVKDLSLFRLSWHVFEQEPFNTVVGISQILCGSLLLINRTVILGALMFLPIVVNILIIDLTIMSPAMAEGFAWRLSFYIILDFLILWHYKDKMLIIWHAVWDQVGTRFKFPIWSYALLPVFAIGLEIVGILPKILYNFITAPKAMFGSIYDQMVSLIAMI